MVTKERIVEILNEIEVYKVIKDLYRKSVGYSKKGILYSYIDTRNGDIKTSYLRSGHDLPEDLKNYIVVARICIGDNNTNEEERGEEIEKIIAEIDIKHVQEIISTKEEIVHQLEIIYG